MKTFNLKELLTNIMTRFSSIGTIYRDSGSASLANTTSLTKLSYSYSLPAGRWIVNYSIRFQTSVTTGTRGASVGMNSTQYAAGYAAGPGTTAMHALSGSTCFMSNAQWTLNFYARQNSGATTTVDIFWDAIRVGPY